MQSGDLTFADVGNLQVRVQQQVERERQLLGWIVHADVEVKLLLPQYDAICDAEAVEWMIDSVICSWRTSIKRILTGSSTWSE